jgi:hypothetical protein
LPHLETWRRILTFSLHTISMKPKTIKVKQLKIFVTLLIIK